MKIILVVLCSYFVLACAKKTVHTPLLPTENHLNELNQSVEKSNEQLKPKKILISFVGDVILHERIRKRHDVTNEGFDSIWSELQTYFDRADLRYANLEGPVAPQLAKPSGFPRFNYPERIIEDLKKSGFDVVSTANNHSLDRGSEGVIQTIKNLDQHKLSYTGTIKNQIKAAVDPALDKKTNQDTWWVLTDVSPEIKHKKIAWIACTEMTNGLRDLKKQVLYCYKDKKIIEEAIDQLKSQAEVAAIILLPHWGEEETFEIEIHRKVWARRLLDRGASAVVGSHPHILQKIESYKTKDNREAIIAYSLGNFISNQGKVPNKLSMILFLQFEYDFKNESFSFQQAKALPIWMQRRQDKNGTSVYRLKTVESVKSMPPEALSILKNQIGELYWLKTKQDADLFLIQR